MTDSNEDGLMKDKLEDINNFKGEGGQSSAKL